MDNNATDSVDAMAYALLSKKWPAAYPELIREVRREVQWLRGFVPHPEAEMSLKIGVFTKTFRIARNYDGWAISDVLEDMAQMFRGKESAGSSHNSKAVTGDAPRTPKQGPTLDVMVKMAQELAAKYPKPSFSGRRDELWGLGRGLTCQPRYTYGKHVSEWESLLPPACEHCGGQPQKWDSDARCMVSGGECGHCGAGKDEHRGR